MVDELYESSSHQSLISAHDCEMSSEGGISNIVPVVVAVGEVGEEPFAYSAESAVQQEAEPS